MTNWEVWTEGYAATGDRSEANFHGVWPGETFRDAVQAFVNTLKGRDLTLVNMEDLTWWGCRFFDNESDARKSFG